MAELTREQAIENLRAVLCDPEGKCCITGSDEDRRIITAALRSLSAPSATATTGEFVSVPKEPTLEMWDAAWKSIGLPYRAKLSLHEIKTLFEKFHAAMLAAAPDDSKGTAAPVEAGRIDLEKANVDLATESALLRGMLSSLVQAVDDMQDTDEMDGPEFQEASDGLDAILAVARPYTEQALLEKHGLSYMKRQP